MRLFFILISCALVTLAGARELPWMGVSLNSVATDQRQVLSLPAGVGFEVTGLVAGGPFAEAGGQAGDIWWKLDSQILINKGQLVVLLRSKSPGEKVTVEFYRGGELKRLALILGGDDRRRAVPVSLRKGKSDEARVLAKREKIARVEVHGSEVSLEGEGKKWRFKIKQEGSTVLSALVTDGDIDEKIPSKWHGAYLILRMTLDSSARSSVAPVKKRVRFIPQAKSSDK